MARGSSLHKYLAISHLRAASSRECPASPVSSTQTHRAWKHRRRLLRAACVLKQGLGLPKVWWVKEKIRFHLGSLALGGPSSWAGMVCGKAFPAGLAVRSAHCRQHPQKSPCARRGESAGVPWSQGGKWNQEERQPPA